jgi:putative heme-binding domain-containing protein
VPGSSPGRGSPTGVVCYRHTQFPSRFRGGLFVLDWTFGKVYFVGLRPEGASYRASAEVFLEPVGTSGFAPTDAEVAPDGSLLVSIGGRKTRGSVYRVSYAGPRDDEAAKPATDLDAVLRAPQPLDAWSRARWVPLATKLGRGAFLKALEDRSRPDAEHVRAVEVLTELFGGLDRPRARLLERQGSDAVRRRLAWSLGRAPLEAGEVTMADLTGDPEPGVRVVALDAWRPAAWKKVRQEWQVALLVLGLGHSDKRVRQSAARLAAASPQATWDVLAHVIAKAHPQMRLSAMLAEVWRDPARPVHEGVAARLCELLAETRDPALRFQAVRLIQRALGDYHLKDPAVEVETAYSLQPSLKGQEPLVGGVLKAVRPLFPAPTGQGRFPPPAGQGGFDPRVPGRLDEESARLLAMLEDDDPETPRKVAGFWTATSPPTRDLHFLIVFARLRGPRDAALSEGVARAVVALDGKLKGQEQRIKQSWNARLVELVGLLQGRDPRLAEALLRQPGFVAPNHVAVALGLPAGSREVAARRFLAAARDDPEFVWSGPLIELLSALPPAEVRPAFRARWSNIALRDALLPALASPPDAADRPAYLDALGSSQPDVVRAAMSALEALPRDPSPERLLPLIRLVRRLAREPRERELTRRVVALLERQTGTRFEPNASTDGPGTARRVDEAVIAWFRNAHPDLSAQLSDSGVDLAAWTHRLKGVDWPKGDPARGAKLFQERGCQTCHDGPRALGPDLAGVTDRLARDDLFASIVAPNLDVSPLYRTTLVETRQGLVYSGTVAFESADGLILQTGATTTVRVANDDIASRQPGTTSLMPERLLEGCSDRDLADLDHYLRFLSARKGR